MKALSLWQPWASLIADGRKKIETRHWPMRYRGPLAIHAAKGNLDKEFAFKCGFGINGSRCPLGAVVCIVKVDDCVRFPSEKAPPDIYGDFYAGRYGFLLSVLEVFDPAIPATGHQGIWDWERPSVTVADGGR